MLCLFFGWDDSDSSEVVSSSSSPSLANSSSNVLSLLEGLPYVSYLVSEPSVAELPVDDASYVSLGEYSYTPDSDFARRKLEAKVLLSLKEVELELKFLDDFRDLGRLEELDRDERSIFELLTQEVLGLQHYLSNDGNGSGSMRFFSLEGDIRDLRDDLVDLQYGDNDQKEKEGIYANIKELEKEKESLLDGIRNLHVELIVNEEYADFIQCVDTLKFLKKYFPGFPIVGVKDMVRSLSFDLDNSFGLSVEDAEEMKEKLSLLSSFRVN